MHVKLATLATAALAASTSALTQTESVYKHPMYEVENQICINKDAVMTCRDGYTPIYDETYRSTEVWCLERNHALVRDMQSIMETGNNLRVLRSEAVKRQLSIRSTKRCVKSNIDLTIRNNENTRTSDSIEQKTKFETKYRFTAPQAEREIDEKLIELNKNIPTFVQAIQLSDNEYRSVFELLKEVNKYEKMHYALHHLTKQMPALYVQVVREVEQTLLGKLIDESLTKDEQDLKKEVKRLAERVYAHIMFKFDQQIQNKRLANIERLEDMKLFEVVPVLESLWKEIRTQLPGRTVQSIEKHMIEREVKVEKQIESQVQVDELQLQPINKHEKKQIQMLLEKVFLASIHLTKDVQEGKLEGARREGSLLNKFFDKEARYIQLIKMYKQKFNFDF